MVSELQHKVHILTYRRKKQLCLLCGKPPTQDHKCIENYIKADTKKISDEEIEQQIANPNVNIFKKKTIIAYRRKKGLCLVCGSALDGVTHTCAEEYTKSDNRPLEEKKKEDLVVITPRKSEVPTIEQQMTLEVVNKMFIQNSSDDFMKLEKKSDFICNRPYLIIDLNKSETSQKVSFDYLNFMSRKYKNMVLYTIGDYLSLFSFQDLFDLKKLKNVSSINTKSEQTVIDALYTCCRFFGFQSKYCLYCLSHNIKCTMFVNSDFENISPFVNIVKMGNDKQNLDIHTVQKNILAYRI